MSKINSYNDIVLNYNHNNSHNSQNFHEDQNYSHIHWHSKQTFTEKLNFNKASALFESEMCFFERDSPFLTLICSAFPTFPFRCECIKRTLSKCRQYELHKAHSLYQESNNGWQTKRKTNGK